MLQSMTDNTALNHSMSRATCAPGVRAAMTLVLHAVQNVQDVSAVGK